MLSLSLSSKELTRARAPAPVSAPELFQSVKWGKSSRRRRDSDHDVLAHLYNWVGWSVRRGCFSSNVRKKLGILSGEMVLEVNKKVLTPVENLSEGVDPFQISIYPSNVLLVRRSARYLVNNQWLLNIDVFVKI